MAGSTYDLFARFYDDVLGDAGSPVAFIQNLVRKYNPGGKDVLELGCGTGVYLNALKEDFNVTGIDISGKMLKIAGEKIPEGKFYKMNIEGFKLDRNFDVILCLYDTINHITRFNEWKKVFHNVHNHLNENGIFIFDYNTLSKLGNMSQSSPYVHKFNNNFLILDVKKKTGCIYNWNLKVFENISGNDYRLTEADVPEASFEADKIRPELLKHFKVLKMIESNENKITNEPDRIFFICRKQGKK
jgi:SAM-dependent methyltransferase